MSANQPAFPCGSIHKRRVNQSDPGSDFAVMSQTSPMHSGMTLRDWFAGMALAGMFAADTPESCIQDEKKAVFAYKVADLMLKAREAT